MKKHGKFNIIICDAPFHFDDRLKQSSVKRGAEANYKGTLSDKEILELPVKDIVADNALLAFWVPSAKLQLGLDTVKAWGFEQKQTWIWVKIQKNPFKHIKKELYKSMEPWTDVKAPAGLSFQKKHIKEFIKRFFEKNNFDINSILSMYMGRYFRQCHEIVLIGARGKIASKIKNKSQVSVFMGPIGKHSEKPEALQDKLDIMLPSKRYKRLELFGRRSRPGYIVLGNESPDSYGEDIRDSLVKLING